MTVRVRVRVRVPAAEGPPSGNLARLWAEAFEEAGLPLARPEGSRRVRIELGPPLPAGVAGEAEPLDAWLADAVPCDVLVERLAATAPAPAVPVAAEELGERLPSLTALLRGAVYRFTWAPGAVEAAAVRARVDAFRSLDTLEWEELRGERVRRFDLRAMVRTLDVTETAGAVSVDTRVVLTHDRTMRPASLLDALGIGRVPEAVMRVVVEVEEPRVALRAWRERGRFA